MTLLVETPDGWLGRRVPAASPLRPAQTHGAAAENATHDAAAVWGLPDFVYAPKTEAVSSGVRELGDGFVIAGSLGLTLQVKSREVPSSDREKERRWLEKKAAGALRQGRGTIRRMRRAPVRLANMRGRDVFIDGREMRWLNVAIIDHPDAPEGVTPSLETPEPAVVLLRRDWEFLFDQLKSTHAVANYLWRVADDPHALGDEPSRYYDLALADAAAAPEELDPALVGAGELSSVPLLPLMPAGDGDQVQHGLIRIVLEDIARTTSSTISEEDRVRVLSELDSLPVGHRAGVGAYVLEGMRSIDPRETGMSWRLRSMRGSLGRTHLGFGTCSSPHTAEIQQLFAWWVQLRHHDLQQITEDDELTTVGVLLTPRRDGTRPWDTTVATVAGRVEFSDPELQELRAVWPSPSS